ncbi:MAG: chorismate synthase [Pseudomonadota bacterium]
MAGDSFGKHFKVTSWGESHGPAVGIVVEGCPSGLMMSEVDLQKELDRRKPGQSDIVTQRKEPDSAKILSGVVSGKTTGTPISLMIENKDQKSKDYSEMSQLFRPSHADYGYHAKYGIRDVAGGGRSSARITAGMVAAGAIAKKILWESAGVNIVAYVKSIQELVCDLDPLTITEEAVEANAVRCPDSKVAGAMESRIKQIRKQGDSIGGTIECICHSVPEGLGQPVFDRLEADLAKAMMSINATKGFEIGSGFQGTHMKGSEHNDIFFQSEGKVRTRTNHSGGVLGGISNGMPIIFRVAFKPTATIIQDQETVNEQGEGVMFKAKGRHDPCVLPRAVPIVEAMAALVICDHYLLHRMTRL